jgi:hypothetical protein
LWKADDTSTLFIHSKPTDGKKGRSTEFEFKLTTIESDKLGVPDTRYLAHIFMHSSEFKKLMNDISTLGDTVEITVSPEEIEFAVVGDIAAGKFRLPNARTEKTSIDKPESCLPIDKEDACIFYEAFLPEHPPKLSLLFAVRYLNTFAKHTTLSDMVHIAITLDAPILVQYPLYTTIDHPPPNPPPIDPTRNPKDQKDVKSQEESKDQQTLVQQTLAPMFNSSKQKKTETAEKAEKTEPKKLAGSKRKKPDKIGASSSSGQLVKVGHVSFYLAPKIPDDLPADNAAQQQPKPDNV